MIRSARFTRVTRCFLAALILPVVPRVLGSRVEEEAVEILQGLDEDQLSEELRLLQVKLSLQRELRNATREGLEGHVAPTTTLPQLQMRYQHVQPEDLAWSARQTAMPKDPLHEVLEADIEPALGSGLSGGGMPVLPQHKAEWIQFSDEDPRKGFVKGMIQVGPAANESDISHYYIFWASNKRLLNLIICLPKGIYEHHLGEGQEGVPIPPGANQLVVKTSNAAGMMEAGVSTSVFDFWRPPMHQLLKGLFKG